MSRLFEVVVAPDTDIEETIGAKRREVYIDAKDLQSELDDGTSLDIAQYKDLLKQRGIEKLAVYLPVKSLESAVQPDGYTYGEDYALGDTVTVKYATIGVSYHTSIEAVTRSGSSSEESTEIEFGNGVLAIALKLRTRLV